MFTITRHTDPSLVARAMAPTRSRVEDAVADMGDGVVWDGLRLVAFHERHLALLERRAGA